MKKKTLHVITTITRVMDCTFTTTAAIVAAICMLLCMLQGCVPAVFVAGAAAGATAGSALIYEKRSTKTMIDDRDIVYKAQTKIDNDVELKDKTHIAVTAYNRQVLLVGQAQNADLRNRALNLVNTVGGIKVVHNEITVDKPTSASVRANDAWLTTKVKSALVADKELHASQIKVLTENSIVYLQGLTTRNHADVAAKLASQVEGVSRVVKLFEYVSL